MKMTQIIYKASSNGSLNTSNRSSNGSKLEYILRAHSYYPIRMPIATISKLQLIIQAPCDKLQQRTQQIQGMDASGYDINYIFVEQILRVCVYLSSGYLLSGTWPSYYPWIEEIFVLPDRILLYNIPWIKSSFSFVREINVDICHKKEKNLQRKALGIL